VEHTCGKLCCQHLFAMNPASKHNVLALRVAKIHASKTPSAVTLLQESSSHLLTRELSTRTTTAQLFFES
jgi:hypothetical protein